MATTPSKSRDQKQMEQQDRIQEMRDEQGSGRLPRIEGNRSRPFLNPPTKVDLTIREDEAAGYVHVFTRNKHFQPATNDFMYEDSVVSLHVGQFDAKLKEGYFQTFGEVYIIHDPRQDKSYTQEELKPGKAVLDAPQLNPADNKGAQQAAATRKKEKELADKEKALVAKQAELDAREAALNALPETKPTTKLKD